MFLHIWRASSHVEMPRVALAESRISKIEDVPKLAFDGSVPRALERRRHGDSERLSACMAVLDHGVKQARSFTGIGEHNQRYTFREVLVRTVGDLTCSVLA